jgi:hypothetical protein
MLLLTTCDLSPLDLQSWETTMNLEPVDPEAFKADLYKALAFYDAGQTDAAINSIEAFIAKLEGLLENIDRLEESLSPPKQSLPSAPEPFAEGLSDKGQH